MEQETIRTLFVIATGACFILATNAVLWGAYAILAVIGESIFLRGVE